MYITSWPNVGGRPGPPEATECNVIIALGEARRHGGMGAHGTTGAAITRISCRTQDAIAWILMALHQQTDQPTASVPPYRQHQQP